MRMQPPRSTFFPYTTLFRSEDFAGLEVLGDKRVTESDAIRHFQDKWSPSAARQRLSSSGLVVVLDQGVEVCGACYIAAERAAPGARQHVAVDAVAVQVGRAYGYRGRQPADPRRIHGRPEAQRQLHDGVDREPVRAVQGARAEIGSHLSVH